MYIFVYVCESHTPLAGVCAWLGVWCCWLLPAAIGEWHCRNPRMDMHVKNLLMYFAYVHVFSTCVSHLSLTVRAWLESVVLLAVACGHWAGQKSRVCMCTHIVCACRYEFHSQCWLCVCVRVLSHKQFSLCSYMGLFSMCSPRFVNHIRF